MSDYMADLLKCPFCGGEAETENRHNRYTDWWEVKCTDCNASLNERYEYEFEAVAAWNTRKPMEDVVAELENAMKTALDKVKLPIPIVISKQSLQEVVDMCFEEATEIVRNGGKE